MLWERVKKVMVLLGMGWDFVGWRRELVDWKGGLKFWKRIRSL
jgi:hypothetical protein